MPWLGRLDYGQPGVFYGTTQYGGPSNGGTAFQLEQVGGVWTETVLYSFTNPNNRFSASALLRSGEGALYRTTVGSKGNAGMVFKLRP